jgi:hypothetical protein
MDGKHEDGNDVSNGIETKTRSRKSFIFTLPEVQTSQLFLWKID